MRKVWRIFRFAKRYELRDDERKLRQSGLLFTRDFVSEAAGDEAARYYLQLGMMDNGDGERYHLLLGIYRRLVNEAAKRSRAYRGYLIGADDQPLSDAAIGRLLKINTKRMAQLLNKLESVKLLEHVNMPKEFDKSLNDPPKEDDGKENKPPKKGRGKGKRGANSGAGRNRAEQGGKGRRPLKKKTTTATVTATVTANDNGNLNGNENICRQKRSEDNSNALEGQREREVKTTSTTPTTAPPIMPKGSDARGSRVIPFSPAPSGSVGNHGPQRIGDIVQGMAYRYDEDAKQFGGDIYLALAIPFSPDSIQGRRELGCFASMWTKAKGALIGAEALEELRTRAIKEAGRIAKRKGKCGKVSAVWCTVFNRLLAARCDEERCKVM
jgi:hypothetical protein